MMETFTVFGKQYTALKHSAWAMGDIKDRSLRELFELFETVNPDHPTLKNTVIHFLQKEDHVDLLWTCGHYEACIDVEISGLLHFMNQLKRDVSNEFGTEIHLEYLDSFAEKLIIWVTRVAFEFPETPDKVHNQGLFYGDNPESSIYSDNLRRTE